VPTGSSYDGGLALLFTATAIPGSNITNSFLNSGNVAIDTSPLSGGGGPSVPEPASVIMLGIGLVGMAVPKLRRLARREC
jgi:hypothetical protein